MTPSTKPPADLAAHELKKIVLPESFPCKDCDRDKAPSMFANKYHGIYRFAKNNNPAHRVTRANTTMRCRKCTGDQIYELKCRGQCGLWKPLEGYSKRQRGNGENWCMECIKWKLSQEPGTTVSAGPGHELAPDEFHGPEVDRSSEACEDSWDEDDEYDYDSGDPEWDFGRDSTISKVLAKMSVNENISSSSINSLQLRNSVAPSSTLSTSNSEIITTDYVPPHLRGRGFASSVSQSTTPSAACAPNFNATGYCPPHLRQLSSRSSGMEPLSSSNKSYGGQLPVASPAGTADGGPTRLSASLSNAYANTSRLGPSGSSTVTPSIPGIVAKRGTQPAPQLTHSSLAARASPPLVVGANGWVKSTGDRRSTPTHYKPKPASGRATNFDYDSDASRDEM